MRITALQFSLVLEATALVLLRVALRERFWQHIGAMFVVAAVIYHGVSEVLSRASVGGPERFGTTPAMVDRWLYFVGPAILLFTASYLIVLGKARCLSPSGDHVAALRTSQFLRWRALAWIVVPMYFYALAGRVSTAESTGGSYLQSGLVSQFLLVGLVLLGYGFVADCGRKYAGPVLIAESSALLLLGERLTVIAVGVMLLYAYSRLGLKATRRQVVALILFATASALFISGARVATGREAFGESSGATSRVSATLSGIRSLITGYTSSQFVLDYVHRLDGNDVPTFALDRQRSGVPPVGFQTLRNDFLLAVPSFLAPSKLNSDIVTRNEEVAIETHYFMPPMNRLPTALGTLAAYKGAWWLEVFALASGFAFGVADRWLKRPSPVRLVVGVALVECVVYYERSLDVYTTTLRGALVLVVILWAAQSAVRVVRSYAKPTPRRVPAAAATEANV